jgi:hypothetical protein
MQLAKVFFGISAGVMLFTSAAFAVPVAQEHVTGGTLDLNWVAGFGVSNKMEAATLLPGHPAYNNPSGDHTVAVATNSMAPDSGGIVCTGVDPLGIADYEWEGWIFTGDGSTRRGLVVRADPSDPNNAFTSCYQFVIEAGLFQFRFRKLVNSAPTTLASWFATDLPAQTVSQNTWYPMKVIANGSEFRCFFDGHELTSGGAIVDSDLPTGWVGVYNFRFDLGGVPFYTDDLVLSFAGPTPVAKSTWGQVKNLYRR